MRISRREALKVSALSACSLALGAAENGATPGEEGMKPLDYGLSFLCNTAEFNAVRFWIESRTRIIDDEAGTSTDYYQCASCKSEDTFAKQNLFYEENYDFLPIWGGGRWLIFRRTLGLNPRYRMIKTGEEMWGEPVLKLREPSEVSVLDTWEAIRDATAAAIPLVTQTEITNPETRLRAIIECPTKTMNVSIEKRLYQVDTGPIALPDLAQRYDPQIDSLKPAFIAFNAPDFADFVVEQPLPVVKDNPESPQAYHYGKPFSLPAKNRLLALGGARG